MTNVGVTDLNMAIQNQEDIIILDVRTAGEIAEGFVENAAKVDVNDQGFDEGVSFLDKSKPVFVYCRSGHRSQIASKKLLKMGFTDVRNVEGGFMAWQQAGYPVSK